MSEQELPIAPSWSELSEEARAIKQRLDALEMRQKHDGKLDERGDAIASYGKAYLSKSAKDVHIDGYDDGVCLSPKQTLSLLAWLRQEEARLEQLVKEQERG